MGTGQCQTLAAVSPCTPYARPPRQCCCRSPSCAGSRSASRSASTSDRGPGPRTCRRRGARPTRSWGRARGTDRAREPASAHARGARRRALVQVVLFYNDCEHLPSARASAMPSRAQCVPCTLDDEAAAPRSQPPTCWQQRHKNDPLHLKTAPCSRSALVSRSPGGETRALRRASRGASRRRATPRCRAAHLPGWDGR